MLTEKYAASLHDHSLVCTRRLAALNAKNSRSAMRLALGNKSALSGGGMSDGAACMLPLGDRGTAVGDLAVQSMVGAASSFFPVFPITSWCSQNYI